MKKVLKEIGSILIYLLIAVVLSWLIITFVGQRVVVDGSSMEATLSDRDNLIVDKISYRFNDPQRFDIIVFPAPYNEKENLIKRIIGLPGETVQIDKQGNIYINGNKLEENYGRETINPENIGIAQQPIKLGEDEYFVMGDNRNHSMDSRTTTVGNVKRQDIIGRAWVRIWPFSEFGVLKHQ